MHEVEVTAEEKEKLKAEKNENSNDAHACLLAHPSRYTMEADRYHVDSI